MKTASRSATFGAPGTPAAGPWVMAVALASVLVAIVVSAPGAAWADPEASVSYYEDGRGKYKAGEFVAAIELFGRAYQEYPDPAYLFNIAQSHRKLEHCSNALRFYRQFLAESSSPPNQARVEEHIATLNAKCPAPDESSKGKGLGKASNSGHGSTLAPGTNPDSPVSATESSGSTATSSISTASTRSTSAGLSVAVGLGAAVFDLGDVVTPTVAALRLSARHGLAFGSVRLGAGLSAQLSSLPYLTSMGEDSSLITTVLGELHAGYRATDELALGFEFGAGMLNWSGLGPGNPFARDGMEIGSQATVALRFAVTAGYRIAQSWSVGLSAARIQASAGDELRTQISSIGRTEFLGGLRFHL